MHLKRRKVVMVKGRILTVKLKLEMNQTPICLERGNTTIFNIPNLLMNNISYFIESTQPFSAGIMYITHIIQHCKVPYINKRLFS